ncbi:MAG: DUF2341 domain-containing protein [Acidimicrobiales bacterium]|nr:DUF2341 domain-containing protein [Acidimicrobiales bacterium]
MGGLVTDLASQSTERPGTGRADRSDRIGRRVTASLGALAVVLGLGVAWALYGDTTGVSGNDFGTEDCFDASLASVQSGVATNVASGTQTVAITAVDTAASFVLATVASNSDEPADSLVVVRLASATELEIVRSTDAGAPPTIDVRWSVVEYSCGVVVQHGSTAGNGTATLDVAVGAVDPASSFVLWSAVPDAADVDLDGDDLVAAELVTPTTLRLVSASGATLPADHTYAWQVVSFTAPGDAVVQKVSATLSPGETTEAITLPATVDPLATFLVAGITSAGSGPDVGERLVRVHLVDADTVSVTRLVDGDAMDVSIQVVSLAEGTTVRHGTLDIGSGFASATATFDPVDLTHSVAMSTVAFPGVVSGGASDLTSSDTAGTASGTFALDDPRTVTVARTATAGTATFGWQVIEWGGPRWWDGTYSFRRRLDVSAATVAAPDEYTVVLQFDHAALVASELSLADGSDVRVLRWDGAAWTELDRVLDDASGWNAVDTTIWFRTTEPVGAASTASYWLYHGNGSPGPVLADPEGVYALYEGFESGTTGDFEDRTGSAGWYAAQPWTRRILVTVDAAEVSADLTDFPLLVELTDADLAANAQADGSDIRFTAADGTTQLDHEIERYDSATGTLTAWVRVPTVSATVDTTIHLYYGASDAPDQQDVRSVWSASSQGVWHAARDPEGDAPLADDSSATNHDGTVAGAMTTADLVTGAAGQGLDLDGVDDRLEVGSFDVVANALTLSGWVRPDSTAVDGHLVAKAKDATTGIFELTVTPAGAARVRVRLGGVTYEATGGTVSVGSWHHLAATWDGATLRLYVDGAQVDTSAAAGVLDADDSMPVTIGNTTAADGGVDGRIDEVRVESTARSAAWVAASHAQVTSPTFTSYGAPTSGSWFLQGTWAYRKPLAVDSSQLSGTLVNQPVLVQLVDADLAAKAQADGDDIVFTAADGITRLDHELESWNAATGAVSAWVRVPSVSSTSDTGFFVYYGNPGADDQQDPVGVFGPSADLVAALDGPG